MPKLKKIPKFATEQAEQTFWETHDSSEYVDWSQAKNAVFPDLKPTTQTISLRLPEFLLFRIKMAANKRDMPYQTYLKMLVDQGLHSDERRTRKVKT